MKLIKLWISLYALTLTFTVCAIDVERTVSGNGTGTPQVSLAVMLGGDEFAWTLEEEIPNNLIPTNISNSGVWDANTQVIRWGVFNGEQVHTLTYNMTGNNGTYILTGNVSDDGYANRVSGDTEVILEFYAPTDIILSSNSISENQLSGSLVGNFSSTDQDEGDAHIFTLVSGTGDTDNVSFTIDGTDLKIAESFDFETKATYSIRVRARDLYGLIYEKVFSIFVLDLDEVVPVITVNPVLIELEVASELPNLFFGVTASDDVDGNLSSAITTSGLLDMTTPGGYTISYNLQDSSGNAALTVTRLYRVLDNVRPVITLSSELIPLEAGSAHPDLLFGLTASDNVDGDISEYISSTGNINMSVPNDYLIRYNVSDSSGNNALEKTRTYRVGDTIKPVITVDPTEITLSVGSSQPDFMLGVTASDNVDGDITESITSGGTVATSNEGDYIVFYNVSDVAGNNATMQIRTYHVLVSDIPVITVSPLNVNVEYGAETGSFTDGVTASDYSDGDLTSSIVVSGTVDTFLIGTQIVTYNVYDSDENSALSITRTYTVLDTTAPILTVDSMTVVLAYGADAPNLLAEVTATDNYDGDLTASIQTNGSVNTSVLENYTVTYDVADSFDNQALQQSRLYRVQDNISPVLTIDPTTVTLNVGDAVSDYIGGVTASDNVDGSLTASIVISGSVNTSLPNDYMVSYSVEDSSANISTGYRIYHVVDNEKPVISVNPTEVTLSMGASSPNLLSGITAIDNVDLNISSSVTASGSINTSVIGDYTVNYTVTDSSENVADTVSRTYHVVDDIPPVITIEPDNIILEFGGSAPSFADGVSATDNVDGDLTASVVPNADDIAALDTEIAGSYTINYSVTDLAGNTSEDLRIYHVLDSTPPVLTVIPEILEIAAGTAIEDIYFGITVTDDGSGYNGDSLTVSGFVNTGVLGDYNVTYTVEDNSQNTATAQRIYRVIDGTAPVMIVSPQTITISLNSTIENIFEGVSANDTIDGDLTGSITKTGTVDTGTPGDYIIDYSVSDNAGNTSTGQRIYTVTDDMPPEITVNPQIIYLSLNDIQPDLYSGVTAVDNVDGDLSSSVTADGIVDPAEYGIYKVVYNVKDSTGNYAPTEYRFYIILDVTPPVITVDPNDVDIAVGNSAPDLTDSVTAYDTHDGDITFDIVVDGSVNVNTLGEYMISYDVVDSSNISAITKTRTYNVVSREKPILTVDPEVVYIQKDSQAIDLTSGVTASDSLDGDLTASVVISGSVDTSICGEQVVAYDVVNSGEVAAERKTRAYHVVEWVLWRITDETGELFAMNINAVNSLSTLKYFGKVKYKNNVLNDLESLAVSPLNGKIYSVHDNNKYLYEIDVTTLPVSVERIGKLQSPKSGTLNVKSLAFDSSGVLYGVGTKKDALFSIDITDASVEKIVDLPDTHIEGLTFSSEGLLYATSNTVEPKRGGKRPITAKLLQIDMETGNYTIIKRLDEEAYYGREMESLCCDYAGNFYAGIGDTRIIKISFDGGGDAYVSSELDTVYFNDIEGLCFGNNPTAYSIPDLMSSIVKDLGGNGAKVELETDSSGADIIAVIDYGTEKPYSKQVIERDSQKANETYIETVLHLKKLNNGQEYLYQLKLIGPGGIYQSDDMNLTTSSEKIISDYIYSIDITRKYIAEGLLDTSERQSFKLKVATSDNVVSAKIECPNGTLRNLIKHSGSLDEDGDNDDDNDAHRTRLWEWSLKDSDDDIVHLATGDYTLFCETKDEEQFSTVFNNATIRPHASPQLTIERFGKNKGKANKKCSFLRGKWKSFSDDNVDLVRLLLQNGTTSLTYEIEDINKIETSDIDLQSSGRWVTELCFVNQQKSTSGNIPVLIEKMNTYRAESFFSETDPLSLDLSEDGEWKKQCSNAGVTANYHKKSLKLFGSDSGDRGTSEARLIFEGEKEYSGISANLSLNVDNISRDGDVYSEIGIEVKLGNKYKAVAKLFTEDGSVVNGRLNIMKDGHVEKELLYNWRLLLNTQVNLGIEVFDGVVTFYKDGEVLSKYPESGHDIFMFAGTEFISSGENCDFEGLVSDIEALINNQCSYELSPGWNLVSNPLEHHLATEHLFTDLQGNSIKGRMIWYWDATKKVYYELDKKDIPETLKGIWIYSHSGGKTPVVSAEMPENSYSLKKGWNLIGSEKEIEPLDNSTIIGKIWGWDADKGEYFHIDSLDNLPEWQSENEGRGKLKPGHAYWIYYKE